MGLGFLSVSRAMQLSRLICRLAVVSAVAFSTTTAAANQGARTCKSLHGWPDRARSPPSRSSTSVRRRHPHPSR